MLCKDGCQARGPRGSPGRRDTGGSGAGRGGAAPSWGGNRGDGINILQRGCAFPGCTGCTLALRRPDSEWRGAPCTSRGNPGAPGGTRGDPGRLAPPAARGRARSPGPVALLPVAQVLSSDAPWLSPPPGRGRGHSSEVYLLTPEVAWAWHLPAGTRPFTSQSAGCVGGARRDGACAPGTSEPGPGRRSWLNAGASPQGCAFASSRLLRTRRVRSGCMTCCERHRLKGTWRPRSLRPTAVTAGGDVARACGRARGPPGARPLRGRSGS